MNFQTGSRNLNSAGANSWRAMSILKRCLLVTGLTLVLICAATLGAVRLFHNFGGTTISAWRLVLLFANAFFCVSIACALYARGRRYRRGSSIDLGRP